MVGLLGSVGWLPPRGPRVEHGGRDLDDGRLTRRAGHSVRNKMFWCERGAFGGWLELDDRLQQGFAVVLLRKAQAALKWDPSAYNPLSQSKDKILEKVRTLVFPITSLDLLVLALLHLALEDASTLGFVEACDFEDLGRVQPRVVAPSHNCDSLAHPEGNIC